MSGSASDSVILTFDTQSWKDFISEVKVNLSCTRHGLRKTPKIVSSLDFKTIPKFYCLRRCPVKHKLQQYLIPHCTISMELWLCIATFFPAKCCLWGTNPSLIRLNNHREKQTRIGLRHYHLAIAGDEYNYDIRIDPQDAGFKFWCQGHFS